ncbi:hypothetical protein PoB_007079500 [Plakobranchus ocellatus]|uniref:EGF-like domain-containing protein n=1 Tax=Plakobranchus ocellatus TaxID=259542 RepID=A0AAV4DJH3_9GAST|nr:hypothetical protein PoB_007079500 [Plakobranchus ocellatus]
MASVVNDSQSFLLNNNTFDIESYWLLNNTCNSDEDNFPKRWGQDCEFYCNCKNNLPCDAQGYCQNGCRIGWVRNNDTLTCSQMHPKNHRNESSEKKTTVRSHNSTHTDSDPLSMHSSVEPTHPGIDNLYEDTETSLSKGNTNHSKPYMHETGEDIFAVYTFSSEIKCKKIQSHVKYSWTSRMSTPLIINYLYVRYVTYTSVPQDYVKAEFSLSGHVEPIVHFIAAESHPNATQNIYVKMFKLPLLLDKLKISFIPSILDSCSEPLGTGIAVFYGVPVCPYRRWGIHCKKFCKCPCQIAECHPVTGSCLDHFVYCPRGMYGRECERSCSSFCNDDGTSTDHHAIHNRFSSTGIFSRDRHACHVTSGFCRSCPSLNWTGPACDVPTDPLELASIVSSCTKAKNFKYQGKYGVGRKRTRERFIESNYNVWRGQIALLVVSCSIFFFLFVFGVYVGCVRFWARKRLKDYMEAVERQRRLRTSIRSWTELRDEFKEFRTGRGSRILDDLLTVEEIQHLQPCGSSVDPGSTGLGLYGDIKDAKNKDAYTIDAATIDVSRAYTAKGMEQVARKIGRSVSFKS